MTFTRILETSSMKSLRNAFLREILRGAFFVLAKIINFSNWRTRKDARQIWFERKKKLLLGDEVPGHFENQKENLKEFADRSGEKTFLAQTSGTRNVPKTVPYTASRMKLTQKTFLKSMITLTAPFKGRKTFFVFSSIEDDSSLTSGMLKEKSPTLIELLQAPYRFITTPEGLKLKDEVGLLTLRVALITVTSPRYFYATNPSTLTHFLDEVKGNWDLIKNNLKKIQYHPELSKLSDGNAEARLKKLLTLESPDLDNMAPDLIGIISWDGGYVGPFLDRLKEKYPKLHFLPMYSMSTESIETVPHRINGKLHFLPTMVNVLPEFLKDGLIFAPHELVLDECYTLLITDEWGLKRYDTQDEFIVTEIVDGLPDLRFKRRRNITASMTGEKISEDQCLLLFQELRNQFNLSELFLSLYGKMEQNQGRYYLNLIGPKKELELSFLAQRAQEILSACNEEYGAKVQSGRLLPITARALSVSEFAELMGQNIKWESQFKIMPLYEKPFR